MGAGVNWRRILLWLLLALPAVLIVCQLATGQAQAMDLYHPSGELSLRLMLLALLPGPLSEFFGRNRFFRGWLAIRRNLGVAAFAYAVLHLVLYIIDMRALAAMVEELQFPGIWTGWLSLVALLVPAAISFDLAMRRLRRRWQQLQWLVYPAFMLALAHWLLLGWAWAPALIHLAPLALAWLLRLSARRGIRFTRRTI
jgi:sulfoxide reductase heme-binding subunit YedZ